MRNRNIQIIYIVLGIAVGILLCVNRQDLCHTRRSTQEIRKQLQPNFLEKLSNDVQKKIWMRQNPQNCSEARLLVANVHAWNSGFASTIHVVVMHFLEAFYANRTFVFNSKGWEYDEKGWEHYFLPIGKCNYSGNEKSLPVISDKTSSSRIVHHNIVGLSEAYNWKVPKEILAKLKDSHSDPFAWWVGQFVRYMIRFQPWTAELFKEREKSVRVTNSTVGIQIRWGDKVGKEATKHPVSEYMNLVTKWFHRPGHQRLNKSVFVATEESKVWKLLEDNYQEFSLIGSGYVNREKQLDFELAGNYAKRKNELDAIVADVYFLSKCPYVVCTFSSNICRLLYELMATHNDTPEEAIISLDDTYYWLKGVRSYRVIVDSCGHADLEIGDVLKPSRENFGSREGRSGYLLGRGLTTLVPKDNLEIVVEPLNFDM